MRIGITCYPTYGGSGAVATELGVELARRGHQIHLISYASPFRLRGFAENLYFHEVELAGTYPLLEYFPYSLALAVKQEEVALRENLDWLEEMECAYVSNRRENDPHSFKHMSLENIAEELKKMNLIIPFGDRN